MTQTVRYLTSALSVLFFYPMMSSAHHAFSGIFDMNTLLEIEGEVIELVWRNPHVRFSIQTDAGEAWDIETNSVSIIQRMDISSELLSDKQCLACRWSRACNTTWR